MLDLETMGSAAGCAIASIGAVEFDPATKVLGRTFYRVVDLDSCFRLGLGVDGSTINWWLGQSELARSALLSDPRGIVGVLGEFAQWFPQKSLLWSHGASFDIPVLAAAYRKIGAQVPWQFRDERDTRTVLWLTGRKMGSYAEGHHALADAKHQATVIMDALRELKASNG